MNFSSKYVYQKKRKSSIPVDNSEITEQSEKDAISIPRLLPQINQAACRASYHAPPSAPQYNPSPFMKKSMQSNLSLKTSVDLMDEYEPDTNVVTIKFDKLKDVNKMQAGDPIKCQNCDAYLSNLSKVEGDDDKLWKCEFCSFENHLQIENEEIPTNDDVTYMLEPAIGIQSATSTQEINSEYVVYCIDISGSMSVTTRVHGNFRLPTDHIRHQRAEQMAGEPMGRGAFFERYISRLEAVQVALSENLAKLVIETPNKRVGLVTFNQEVRSYGDGSSDEVTINGDYLNKKESIAEKYNLTGDFKPIKDTVALLSDKVLNLEEGGATALGPALYYSILIAARKPGSKVILCTDGLANKGVGALDTDEDQSIYYNELATFAAQKGVSVSIITIKGTDCKLGLLAEIADKTGGLVNIVDPLNLKNEFTSILDDQIIATKVSAKFLLHKALYVKEYENLKNQESCVTKSIGNATIDTEITFEFSIKENIDENVKEVPFQLQIIYNAKDGSKALRVLTQKKPLTTDKSLAEAEADRTVLAQHYVNSNVRLMQKGPAFRPLYQQRQQQWDHYMEKNYLAETRQNMARNDGFSRSAYQRAAKEMSEVLATTNDLYQDAAVNNIQSRVSDESASKGFKLANLKSKFLKKK